MTLQEQVSKIISADVPTRASFFQLNFFILGKEPTHQAKLRRCVDELKIRKQQVDSMLLEIEDTKDRNQLLHHEVEKARSSSNWKEMDIRYKMADRRMAANNQSIEDMTSRIKNVEEEMLFFVQAFERLSEIEPMKQWDDVAVQTEYWNAKLAEDVNHRLLMQIPIDVEILRTVLALPVESPVKKQMLTLLKNQAEKLVGDKTSLVKGLQ